MDLKQTLEEAIGAIQNTKCMQCEFGKLLIGLRDMKNDIAPPKPMPAAGAPTKSTKGTKVCNQCKVSRDLSEFASNKSCRDGHEGTCKQCRAGKKKLANRRYRANKLAKAYIPDQTAPGEKACSKCGAIQPFSAFVKAKNCLNGISGICLKCKKEQDRTRHQAARVAKPEPIPERFDDEKPEPIKEAAPAASREPDKLHQCEWCGKRFMALGSVLSHKKYNCPNGKTA